MPKKITKKIAVPAATPGIKRPGVLKKVRPTKKKVAKMPKSLISRPLPKGPCCTPVDRDGSAFKIPFGYSDILGTKKIVTTPVTNIYFYDREKSPYTVQPTVAPVLPLAAGATIPLVQEEEEESEEGEFFIFPKKSSKRRGRPSGSSKVNKYVELLILNGENPNAAMAIAKTIPKDKLDERIFELKKILKKEKEL